MRGEMLNEHIRDRAEAMTKSFRQGLAIGVFVGGGIMMIMSMIIFVLTLSLRVEARDGRHNGGGDQGSVAEDVPGR